MVKTLVLLALFAAMAAPAFAIDREAYVAAAARELRAYTAVAAKNAAFMRSLSAKENEQFVGIRDVLGKMPARIGTEFSDKAEDFILHPGEPERSAKTTAAIADPVWFNLRKLNDDSAPIDYLTIVQLFVHEIGHKLGPEKDQAAVDSLSVKLREFLAGYSRTTLLYMKLSIDPPRPLRESFELLALPTRLDSDNPNPALFYNDTKKIWPLPLYFEESLKNFPRDRLVQVSFVRGELNLNIIYLEVSFSVYKEFVTAGGETVYGKEGSYSFEENLFMDFGGRPDSGNFRLGKPRFGYERGPISAEVVDLKETSRSPTTIEYALRFSVDGVPENVSILAGTDENSFLVPCSKPERSAGAFQANCTLLLPQKTAISILDLLQVLVDGRTIDLPEVVGVDLEAMDIPWMLADIRPLKMETKSENGKRFYALTMASPLPPYQIRVRCPEKKKFVYDERVLGELDSFTETAYFPPNLPVEALAVGEYMVRASCPDPAVLPVEILVTDGTLYTSRPWWK